MNEPLTASLIPTVSLQRGLLFSELKSPLALGCFILVAAAAGFGISIRGLPFYYQCSVILGAVVCVICFALTIILDPGIITPNAIDDQVIYNLDSTHRTFTDEQYRYCLDNERILRIPLESDEQIDLQLWEKYCTACKIWRPHRAHHCRKCGYCMNRFDHHCAVLGTCIARNNHRFFSVFLLCAHACCAMFAVGGVWRLTRLNFPEKPSSLEDAEMYLILLLTIIYCYICILLIFGLGHCLSIIFDITTKDLLVDSQVWQHKPCCSRRRSPYALLKNCIGVCFAPIGARFVRPIHIDRDELGPYQLIRSSHTDEPIV